MKGRKLVIATMHHKENVIAPLLERALGVKCIVAKNFDSDLLGTFSGEVERTFDPLTTAKNKCLMAMKLNNCDLAIASEGSFGAHPSIGFVHADDEILVLIDTQNNLEISVRELTIETNFNGQEISTERELIKFAENVKFPTHGVIIRKAKGDNSEIIKGITNWELLNKSFKEIKRKYGTAYIETDMRAMYNPTRMKVIAKATQKLIDKINSSCPTCNIPGFGVIKAKPGLPCSLCSFPTQSTLAYEYKCKSCGFTEDKMFPHGKIHEDPTYCNICNP